MPDITPEQRKAVQWAQRKLAQSLDTADAPHLRVLLSIIPEDLKKPPVELPTEKWTSWLDKDGDVWVVDSEGKMQCLKYEDSKPELYVPFRPMAQAVDVEKDERVIAWNTFAKHPLFAEDYGSEDTLINAMMNHLTRIFHGAMNPSRTVLVNAIVAGMATGSPTGSVTFNDAVEAALQGTPQETSYTTAIADEIKVGDKIDGRMVKKIRRIGSLIFFEFERGEDISVGQNRVFENWESGA